MSNKICPVLQLDLGGTCAEIQAMAVGDALGEQSISGSGEHIVLSKPGGLVAGSTKTEATPRIAQHLLWNAEQVPDINA